MIEVSPETIKEIASQLDCGMVVYLNMETKEIVSIIDFNSHPEADEELWEEQIEEIDNNIEKYLSFQTMTSSDSYRMMEEFTENVSDLRLKDKLELGLSLSKPFRNFKDIIDTSGEYRQEWFDFKDEKYIEYVKERLEQYNNDLE